MWKWETDQQPKGVMVVIHDMMEHHEYYADLISRLRRSGYHCITGDLPGHGQTTRVNKGHITDFSQYTDRIDEWYKVAHDYGLPTFLIGQGLGGLIALEAVRQSNLQIDGIILLNPLLSFKQSFMNRKNTLKTSVRTSSDATRFNPGIKMKYFTEDKKFLEQYENDELIVRKVSYHWYRTVINQMKTTTEYLDDFPDVPVLAILSKNNEIVDPYLSAKYVKRINSKEIGVHILEDGEHSIFQRDAIEIPYYQLETFLNMQLFKIGLLI